MEFVHAVVTSVRALAKCVAFRAIRITFFRLHQIQRRASVRWKGWYLDFSYHWLFEP